ncbi:MAG: hypothetical protein JO173_09250 [Gammaproteobacteria bacterium]|nr:hypothetical protein [Gammaproteobacteria bacterium]
MTNEAHLIASELVTKGLLVSFRVLKEEVIAAPADEAEFGLRLLLKFVPEQGEEIFDEDEAAKNTAEWGVFGFVFVVALLSFADARPRNASVIEYREKDEFRPSDSSTFALRARGAPPRRGTISVAAGSRPVSSSAQTAP